MLASARSAVRKFSGEVGSCKAPTHGAGGNGGHVGCWVFFCVCGVESAKPVFLASWGLFVDSSDGTRAPVPTSAVIAGFNVLPVVYDKSGV